MPRTTIKIADMLERTNIADSDLMIVEDDIDTKRATIKELKRELEKQEIYIDIVKADVSK